MARARFTLLAIVAAIGLFFAFANASRAGDKKDVKTCAVCASVQDVLHSMRCDKCAKADKQCDACVKYTTEKLAPKFACTDCDGAKGDAKGEMCTTCKKFFDDNKKDSVEAAKKLMESKTFCCKSCEKGGEAVASKCDHCKELRDKIEKVEVKKSDPDKK
jgi:hypothetical protein